MRDVPALRSVEEQLGDVLAAVRPLAEETLELTQASGRTLRRAVTAAVDLPRFDNSAMDGFAVRFDDVREASATAPAILTVVADLPAGTSEDPSLRPGQAARIMTGAPVPADADAIVPFEQTTGGLADSLGQARVVAAPAGPGAHIRRRGEDLVIGDIVVAPGELLGAYALSAAAAAGVAEVVVSTRPRVTVISTGDELVPTGRPLRYGQIPESNSHLLAELVRETGGTVVVRETVDDEGTALERLLVAVTDPGHPDHSDVVILSGGVSAGAYEVVRTTLSDRMRFTKVAMQPGKPQGFGVIEAGDARTLAFGLPGNPVSVAVSFEVFVRPALLALQGRTERFRPRLMLPAATSWRTPPGRRQYLPARIDRTDPARWTVGPATSGGSGSHLAGGLARAEVIAVVPAETEAVTAGDLVEVMLR
ncbi:molybdopterin molybdotransferase MoeA [Agromyces aerolatus]|uniref:molybdopterin molybdotransferase MoeA n=1 Tax=Agromyces sp. LY-1074 TaxID=3074080 RepID=UPI002855D7F5|nr:MULTISPECIES: gephyrin-like molybdotransferase Glp [unclassified Agromyces]MDR5698788.1 molybdopterin molybdotransferase MoeA [Agromyces sp. LY-1074]MDR5705434.1 molybdopterin molybdotransferase MoeA [Agromyces sp. LY-1358]